MPKKMRLTVTVGRPDGSGDDALSIDLDSLNSLKGTLTALRESLEHAHGEPGPTIVSSTIELVENGHVQTPDEDVAQCPEHPDEVTYLRSKDNQSWWGHHVEGEGWCNAEFEAGQPPKPKMPAVRKAPEDIFATTELPS